MLDPLSRPCAKRLGSTPGHRLPTARTPPEARNSSPGARSAGDDLVALGGSRGLPGTYDRKTGGDDNEIREILGAAARAATGAGPGYPAGWSRATDAAESGGRVGGYRRANVASIPNYGERYRNEEAISDAFPRFDGRSSASGSRRLLPYVALLSGYLRPQEATAIGPTTIARPARLVEGRRRKGCASSPVLRSSACPLRRPSCPSPGQRLAPPLEHFRIGNLARRPGHRRRGDRSPAKRPCPALHSGADSALDGP
jgi:hypothetical protein